MKKWYKYRETETEMGKAGIETQKDQMTETEGYRTQEKEKEKGRKGSRQSCSVTKTDGRRDDDSQTQAVIRRGI